MNRATQGMRLRLLLIGLVLIFLLAALVGRLLWIQVVKAEEYTEQARQVWEKEEVLKPKRGAILDRNGDVLAQEVPAFTIAVYLPSFQASDLSAEAAAAELAPLLQMDEADIVQRLSRKDVEQVELKTSGFSFKIDKDVKDEVMALEIPGVHAIPTTKRSYLNDSLAAHVLGFMNNEGDPVKGVEMAYDEVMEGTQGEVLFSRDGEGMEVATREKRFDPPINGKDITLTIDRRIQEIVEEILEKAVNELSPEGATAILMNPHNGEIIAMANRPTFNPNTFYEAEEASLVNMATESVFEPGSTFKIITLAAALEEGKFHPHATYPSGSIQVENAVLHDWRPGGWGELTFADAVQLSSNVGFVYLQQALGKSFDSYIERFGFGPYGEAREGTPSGIDLDEAQGLLPDPDRLKRSRLERATTAYGHGLSVTPIQLVAAYSAALNGGTLYQPHVLKEVRHPDTHAVLEEKEPVVIRDKIVSEETSAQLRELLHSVVAGEKGTGKQAHVPGYDIGGKTGTANKYNSPYAYISFFSFAPVHDPQIVLYIGLDEPKNKDATGGRTVAPIAGEMLEQILPLLHIDAETAGDSGREETAPQPREAVQLPDLAGTSVDRAKNELKELSLTAEVLGAGDDVLAQVPEAGRVHPDKTVYLLTEKPSAIVMPDLRHVSLREAMAVCNMLGLDVSIEGSGYVYAQSIAPGVRLIEEDTVQLVLKPYKEIKRGGGRKEE